MVLMELNSCLLCWEPEPEQWWALSVRINKFKSIFNCQMLKPPFCELATNQCLMNVRTSIGLVSGPFLWNIKGRKMSLILKINAAFLIPSAWIYRRILKIDQFLLSPLLRFCSVKRWQFFRVLLKCTKASPIFNTLDQTKCRSKCGVCVSCKWLRNDVFSYSIFHGLGDWQARKRERDFKQQTHWLRNIRLTNCPHHTPHLSHTCRNGWIDKVTLCQMMDICKSLQNEIYSMLLFLCHRRRLLPS